MEEKKLFLANGDLLIRSEEGIYFIRHNGEGLPVLIDTEEGERLLFDTGNQLIKSVELLFEKVERYQKGLGNIEALSFYESIYSSERLFAASLEHAREALEDEETTHEEC